MNSTTHKSLLLQQNESYLSQKLPHSSQNQKTSQKQSFIFSIFTSLKQTIHNELKLKKIIQKAQKIDLMNNVSEQNKINIKHFLFINMFLGFNAIIYGIWMFSHQHYRKSKYLAVYALGIAYLGLSFGIFWEDQAFFDRLSTKQDAFKSEIKYIIRKQCLQNIHNLKRIQSKRETFKKLNLQFEKFHQVKNNSKLINLLH